jgi:hypothetical protein
VGDASSRAICWQVRPPDSSLTHAARPENFCTTTLALLTHWDTQGASVTSRCGLGPASGTRSRQRAGSARYLARTARHRLKPMKHDLTLVHVKKEARDLLHGLQRRDPEALRRYHAVDPFTDISKPALDDARFTIAHEQGFSSCQKLKDHIENLRR